MFVEVVNEAASASLQRMLSAVEVQKAETGWIDSLEKGGKPQEAVALLIEAAISRTDALGEMARKLRAKFTKRSRPKARRERPEAK
jgi:hypothetical protein